LIFGCVHDIGYHIVSRFDGGVLVQSYAHKQG